MSVVDINEQRHRARQEEIDAMVQHSNKFIRVTFQKEGIHCYPAALTDPALNKKDNPTEMWLDVSFLGHPHRHMFHFKVEIEIFHNDRDLEFIQVKRICENWMTQGILQLDHKSCEMIGDDLFRLIADKWPGRSVTIEVSEDGENGSVAYYDPIDHSFNLEHA